MRTSILATLLLFGCFDYEALYRGNSTADLSGGDLTSGNQGGPDLASQIAWINTFSGGAGAKPLRGIGGAGGSIM